MSHLPIRSAAPASASRSNLPAEASTNSSNNHPILRPNPRRRPGHEAVSLKHTSRPAPPPPTAPAVKSQQPQDSASQPSSLAANGDSSGESSNVDTWFDKSNKNVSENQNVVNESPPFYFQNSSTDSSNEPAPLKAQTSTFATKQNAAVVTSSGSSSEEYRSVIDDLTIQNKKLRSKLKKYEQIHDPTLESDRLFEVKVYGLSADKKRELEETLRKFTTSLTAPPTIKPALSTVPSTAQASESKPSESPSLSMVKNQGVPDVVQTAKPTSSMSSTRVADSGYGSLTTFSPSAQSSGVHQMHPTPTGVGAPTPNRPSPFDNSKTRNHEIKSYLSDIPEGLRPRMPQAMTEHERKKTVVRRLEQIFGGRGAAPGDHQHQMQQQEVSQSAAQADRSTWEAQGRRNMAEGDREAHIMEMETEEPMNLVRSTSNDSASNEEDGGNDASGAPKSKVDEAEHAEASVFPVVGLEQRPTRPLDLDPDRAQMPAENMDYLRHLGFTMPDAQTTSIQPTAGNWVYLNVLVNMAQLHTINVTTEFVKSAVATHSSKLELSSDGRKVRWRGGSNITRFSSYDGSANSTPQSSSSNANDAGARGKKRNRPAHLERGDSSSYPKYSGNTRKKQATYAEGSEDKFAYKPLFKHKTAFEESDDSDSDLSSEEGDIMLSEASMLSHPKVGFSNTPMRPTHSVGPKRRGHGPIIFYNSGLFCTDLSGDSSSASPATKQAKSSEYQTFTHVPIGINMDTAAANAERMAATEKRPLMEAKLSSQDPDTMHVDGAQTPVSLDMSQFTIDTTSAKSVTFADMDRVIEFEASGIGGVYPADNLCIKVVRQHRVDSSSETSSKASAREFGSKPDHRRGLASASKVGPALPKSPRIDKKSRVSESVLNTRAVRLPPSSLPPPTFALADDERDSNAGSDSDEDEDEDDSDFDGTGLGVAGTGTIRSTFEPRHMDIDSDVSDEESEYDDDDDDNPSQSIDFLSIARKVNPDAIRAREREYDADMADRLADEIPAGSSAATAGGGSGFASPVDMAEKMKKAQDKEAEVADDAKDMPIGSVSS